MFNDTERVDHKKIECACVRQMNKKLKTGVPTMTVASMLNRISAEKFIVEVREGYSIMKVGWREFVKTL
ncbi:MAG: hypothetical protein WC332_01590 [Clostridia bacterium]|jgi:hypothetical protein